MRVVAGIQSLPLVALQTRHAFARLIHLGLPPELHWQATPAGLVAQTTNSTLQLLFEPGHRHCGRLRTCACCQSPGHIEVFSPEGREFLQFCAPHDCPSADWARCLSGLASAEKPSPVPEYLGHHYGGPALPRDAQIVAGDSYELLRLFTLICDTGLAVSCTLESSESRHTRRFTDPQVSSEAGMLTLRGVRTTVQVGLPFVRALAITPTPHGAALHVVGPGECRLFSMTSAGGRHDRPWSDLLHHVFADSF
jgi:hypothetical protein